MKRLGSRIIFGLLLIAGGVLFLMQNLGFLRGDLEILWAFLLGAGGVIALLVFLMDRNMWWALIPGCVLLGVSGLLFLEMLAPRLGEIIGPALVTGGIALSFWLIFVINRKMWWAIIPAGVMTSVTLLVLVEEVFPQAGNGGIILIGIGLTFALLGIIPTEGGNLRWAFFPAAVLLLIGLFTMFSIENFGNLIWPTALVVGGLYLIFRNFRAGST